MASLMNQIKAAVKAKLVANVASLSAATIHTRFRNFAGENDAHFASLFVANVAGSGAKLNGWQIEHEAGASEWAATNHAWTRRDVIVLHGYYGLDDANDSESVFSQIVEDVIEALNADQTIGGVVTTHGTPQIRQYGHAMLGGKLAHYVELALSVVWTCEIQ